MSRITRSAVNLCALAFFATARIAAAQEYAASAVPVADSSASASPRYLQHDESKIPPLPVVKTDQPPQQPAAIDTLAPRLRSAERFVSNPPPSVGTAAAPQALVGGGRPIPLAPPPTDEAAAASHARTIPGLANGALSLGIVLGLFLVVAWALKRGMPKGNRQLPREAVEVLGCATLFAKQQVHLLRCGNKLVLVCIMPGSVETLTEITDPAEVQRLSELCQDSTTSGASFREVFQHISGTRTKGQPYGERRAETGYGAVGVDPRYTREAVA